VLGRHGLVGFGANPLPAVGSRFGQQEFDIMKKLLIATSVVAGVAAGTLPAFAQSATTSQLGWRASADNGAARSDWAQNYPNRVPGATSNDPQDPISNGAHVGDGSRPDYLMHQRELQSMPGYSTGAGG
jgi:hypothetical protein